FDSRVSIPHGLTAASSTGNCKRQKRSNVGKCGPYGSDRDMIMFKGSNALSENKSASLDGLSKRKFQFIRGAAIGELKRKFRRRLHRWRRETHSSARFMSSR